jgi:hypothetical protein
MNEKRILQLTNLRNLCCEEEWYTRGNCFEYESIFEFCKEKSNSDTGLTTEDIVFIAKDIERHTSGKYLDVSTICYKIAKICDYLFFNSDEIKRL